MNRLASSDGDSEMDGGEPNGRRRRVAKCKPAAKAVWFAQVHQRADPEMPCAGPVKAAAWPTRLARAAAAPCAPCTIGPGGVFTAVFLLPNGDRLRIESPTRPSHDFLCVIGA